MRKRERERKNKRKRARTRKIDGLNIWTMSTKTSKHTMLVVVNLTVRAEEKKNKTDNNHTLLTILRD
jgi:hypothetical protein